MPDYRRNRVPGGTYFFTVNLLDRRSGLLVTDINALRNAARDVRTHAPFHNDAWVVLPDHMHCIWTLPAGDDDYSGRWRALKKAFTKSIPANEQRSTVRVRRGERGIWQRRFWEPTIRDDCDYASHMDYVHFNPVKHALAAHPADWPFPSFHRCVALGLYPVDWCQSGRAESGWKQGSVHDRKALDVASWAALYQPLFALIVLATVAFVGRKSVSAFRLDAALGGGA